MTNASRENTSVLSVATNLMALAVYLLAASAFILRGWSWALVGLALLAWFTQGAIRVTHELAATGPRPKWEAPGWMILHWLALGALLVAALRSFR